LCGSTICEDGTEASQGATCVDVNINGGVEIEGVVPELRRHRIDALPVVDVEK